MRPTLADIEAARRIIEGAVLRTPMLAAPRLSALTGAEVFVKYENLQVTNSFKDRGAIVKLSGLDEDQRRRGVIAMSAGNHAQSVAYHARRLGIPATIVMPVTTPFVKVAATRSHGADVVLHGETIAESQSRCEEMQRERGLTLVHPYDDPDIIAGQGTIALEMLEDVPDLDVLVIPIGGGGLISGNAVAAKGRKPAIEIVGAEAALYPSVWNALHGESRPIGGPTLAEGIAVKNVGALTLPIIRALVSELVLVDEAHLERAVNAYLTLQKTMAEGAGAAVLGHGRFIGLEAGLDPVAGPCEGRLFRLVVSLTQICHDAQVLDRMNVRSRDQRQCPDARAADRVLGQKGRLGMRLLEIFEDRQRLRQHLARIEHQRRHQLLWIDRRIVRRPLLALAQMAKGLLGRDALEVEGDANTKRGRRAKVSDKLHGASAADPSMVHAGGV